MKQKTLIIGLVFIAHLASLNSFGQANQVVTPEMGYSTVLRLSDSGIALNKLQNEKSLEAKLNDFSSEAIIGQDRGGGDICENEIKLIRNDIASWIYKGGHKDLKLPENISHGLYFDYMLDGISKAKITCVSKGDRGYPVEVFGIPKVCAFDQSDQSVTCDTEKFKNLSQSDQFVLVHHEYAGLVNIEVPNKDDSNYAVSNQISAYLENKVVKRLVVKEINSSKAKGFLFVSADVPQDYAIDNVYAQKCSYLQSGTSLRKELCSLSKKNKQKMLKLNKSISLEPGIYIISTSVSTRQNLVEVVSNQQTEIKVLALNIKDFNDYVPKAFKSYYSVIMNYYIHQDYTNAKARNYIESNEKKLLKENPTEVLGFTTSESIVEAYASKKITLSYSDLSQTFEFKPNYDAAQHLDKAMINSLDNVWLNDYSQHGLLVAENYIFFKLLDDKGSEIHLTRKSFPKIKQVQARVGSRRPNVANFSVSYSTGSASFKRASSLELKKRLLFPGHYFLETQAAGCSGRGCGETIEVFPVELKLKRD